MPSSDRKFLFVHANGGWDTTRVFFDGFDHSGVDMEDEAERWTVGDLQLVDHPDRPDVRAFFEAYGSSTVVLNGLQVPSVDHFSCIKLLFTGSSNATRADWASTIAGSVGDAYPVPQLLLAGPSFPAEYASAVVRVGNNGQLAGLVDPASETLGNVTSQLLSDETGAAVAEVLNARFARRQALATAGAEADLVQALASARDRAEILRTAGTELELSGQLTLENYMATGVDALAGGLCRVVSLAYPTPYETTNWDTHTDNDKNQSSLFTELFAALSAGVAQLAETPGTSGGSMLDETTVVVFSEMGRTPGLNGSGKDHWPYTSAMLIGSGIQGGRTVGAFDATVAGSPLDPETGELDDDGLRINTENLGATLLHLAGIDNDQELPGVTPITALLS